MARITCINCRRDLDDHSPVFIACPSRLTFFRRDEAAS